MQNNDFNEKDFEAVTGGVSSHVNWTIVGSHILDHCEEDPQYEQLKPDLPELESYCTYPGIPTGIQKWVYDHYSFSVVREAMGWQK